MNWEYGGAYKKHDMTGEISLPNDSVVMVCDWNNRLPDFMLQADTLFVDPPWNTGNYKSFYTKADMKNENMTFEDMTDVLFDRIGQIHPETLFLEMGKENLSWCMERIRTMYRFITFYNSTYFHKSANKCYVIHATNDGKLKRHKPLEDMDEESIIHWICKNHPYSCIGDLCMGRGLVGKYAYMNGKRFVGTELNERRLAVLVDFIRQRELEKRS